jgi:hypothetical protein
MYDSPGSKEAASLVNLSVEYLYFWGGKYLVDKNKKKTKFATIAEELKEEKITEIKPGQ